ncbi:MATE family efflux transporter [Campylobacter sp.]|uniref:MATE family efflux transporter n=1 Tax=Campylobacter sp. TaxID=205 RepID=UPI003F9F937E
MDLLKDPLNKLIISLSLPAGTAMMFNTLYNVTGTFFAAKISTLAVAGMAMSFLLYLSVVGIGLGFGSALTALIGNNLGASKLKVAKFYASNGVVLVLVFALFMGLFGYLLAPRLLILLGADHHYLKEALDYAGVIFIASPFFLLIKSLNGVLVALGDTKSYRNWLFCGLFINAFFCYFFAFILDFGTKGIALATASVQFLGMIYLFFKVKRCKMIELKNLKYYVPNLTIWAKILRQAFPACLNYLSMSIGSLVLLKFISYYGVNAVAGYGIALRIEQILVLPTIGMAAAVLSIVSRNYGAKNFQRVRQCYKTSLLFLLVYCVFACLFVRIFGEHIIKLFDDTPAVLEVANLYLGINSLAYVAYGIINVSGSTLQAIKRPMAIFLLNGFRQFVLQGVLFYTVVFYLGLEIKFMWFALFFSVYFTAICFILWILSRFKRLRA